MIVPNPRSIWGRVVEPVQKLDEVEIGARRHSARAAACEDTHRGPVAATGQVCEVDIVESTASIGPTALKSRWVQSRDAFLLFDHVSLDSP